MAEDNSVTNNMTHQQQAKAVVVNTKAAQPLISDEQLRRLFFTLCGVGTVIILGILLLATAKPRGELRQANEAQFRATLSEATQQLDTIGMNEGNATAHIAIADAMKVVADKGMDQTLADLKTAAEAEAAAAAANMGSVGTNPYKNDQQAIQAGSDLFHGSLGCFTCHGQDGTGGVGPNLVDGQWRYGGTDQDLFTTLTTGRPGGMPSFAAQTDEDTRWKLVSYVASLSKK